MAVRFGIILAISLTLATALHAAPREVVVLVTAEGISLEQLQEWNFPELRHLLERSAFGLMNNRTEEQLSIENNAVTICAGTYAVGASEPAKNRPEAVPCADYSYNTDELVQGERAADIYTRNTGWQAPQFGIVQLGIAPLLELNSTQRHKIEPGLLGQQLGEAGVAVAAFGNSDQGSLISRTSAVIAMDAQGQVPTGDVGRDSLLTDPRRPFGVRMNYPAIRQRIDRLAPGKHFVVVECGDGHRLEAAAADMRPERYEALARQNAGELLHFVSGLERDLRKTGGRYLLCLAVTGNNAKALEAQDLLTPLLITGTGFTDGMLTSSTTRRGGLVTNIDLAPTVLAFFDIKPHDSMLGVPLQAAPKPDVFDMLQGENEKLIALAQARRPVLEGYIYLVSICVLLLIFAVLWGGRLIGAQRLGMIIRTLHPLLFALMLAPLAFLLAPALGFYRTVPVALFLAAFSLSLGYVMTRRLQSLKLAFAITGLITSLALCLDLLLGAPLLKHSLLSYSATVGIRFYGLGNESSGVLVCATVLGWFCLLDLLKRDRLRYSLLLIPIFAGVVYVIGAPQYGADFGGILASLSGYSWALLRLHRVPLRKTFLWCGVVVLILVTAFIANDLMRDPSQQSHIGRAFSAAGRDGVNVLVQIAVRKFLLNIKLLQFSIWTYALISLIIGLLVVFIRPVGILKHVLQSNPVIDAGFKGMMVCVIVGFLANDSGLVMAATGMLYLAIPLMLLVSDHMEHHGRVQPETAAVTQG